MGCLRNLEKLNSWDISSKPIVTTSFLQSILALTIFKKGLPNIMGQKLSWGEPRTRKSAGTSLTIPTGEIVSLLASLIVKSISSISAGAKCHA